MIRERFWVDVYLKALDCNANLPDVMADDALKSFDARFNVDQDDTLPISEVEAKSLLKPRHHHHWKAIVQIIAGNMKEGDVIGWNDKAVMSGFRNAKIISPSTNIMDVSFHHPIAHRLVAILQPERK